MVFHVSGGLAAACGGLLTCFRHFHEKLFRKKQNRLRYTALVETALPQNTLTSGSPNPAFSVRSLNFLFFFFLGGQSSVLPRKPGEEAQPRLTFQTPVSRTPRFQFCWRSLLPAEVFFFDFTTQAMLYASQRPLETRSCPNVMDYSELWGTVFALWVILWSPRLRRGLG